MALVESYGLRMDDYIKKPLRWEELRVCVRTLIRKNKRSDTAISPRIVRKMKYEAMREERVLIVDDLRTDISQRTVMRGNHVIELGRPLLFDLLVYLVQHRGAVLTHRQLLRQVWGYDNARALASDTWTVSVHMHWLREMLGDDLTHQRLIQTVHGIGYQFKNEEEPFSGMKKGS